MCGFGIWVIPVIAVADYPGFVVALVDCALMLAAELVYYGSKVGYYGIGVDKHRLSNASNKK